MLRKTLIIIPTSFEAHKHSQQFLLRESCLVQFFKIYAKLNHFEGIQFSGLPWFSAAHLFCLSNKLKKYCINNFRHLKSKINCEIIFYEPTFLKLMFLMQTH